MSGTDMNDSHVEKLYYRMLPSEHSDYDKASPISGETDDFKWALNKDQLAIDMKTHCTTELNAREIVDQYLRGWEITAGLMDGPGSLVFRFDSSVSISHPSSPKKSDDAGIIDDSLEAILLVNEATNHVSHDRFPPLPRYFKASPDVEMMFFRYKMYREGRETLLGLAYWCLKVLETSAGGRQEASDQYGVDSKVLRKFLELCWTKRDVESARQLKGNSDNALLKPGERVWIRAVVKRLIRRVGEYAYDPVAKQQLITMADFPALS